MQFYSKKYFFPAIKFFTFLVIKTLDQELDPQKEKMMDPDPH
jgi:hypothetical protein